jgi:hypothetical protein
LKKKKRVLSRLKRDKRKEEIEEGTYKISDLFSKDRELVAMREPFNEVNSFI